MNVLPSKPRFKSLFRARLKIRIKTDIIIKKLQSAGSSVTFAEYIIPVTQVSADILKRYDCQTGVKFYINIKRPGRKKAPAFVIPLALISCAINLGELTCRWITVKLWHVPLIGGHGPSPIKSDIDTLPKT